MSISCLRPGCHGNIIREPVSGRESGEPPYRNICTLCSREFPDSEVAPLIEQYRQASEAVRPVTVPRARRYPDKWGRARQLRELGPAIYEYSLTHELKATLEHFGVAMATWYRSKNIWAIEWSRQHGQSAGLSNQLRALMDDMRKSLSMMRRILDAAEAKEPEGEA